MSMEPDEWWDDQRHRQMGDEKDPVGIFAHYMEGRGIEQCHAPNSNDASNYSPRSCQLLEQHSHLHEIIQVEYGMG